MRIGLIPTFRDSLSLFSANIVMLYVEFAAGMVAGVLACALLFPGDLLAAAMARPDDGTPATLFSPLVICLSLAQSLAAASATARLWRTKFGDLPAGPTAPVIAPLLVLTLVTDHLLLIGIALFVLPGLMVLAVTTVYMPALIVERQGWQSLARSFAMTRHHLMALLGIWALFMVPVIILSVTDFRGPPAPDATINQLLFGVIAANWWTPVANGFAMALSLTIYIRLIEIEGGGSGRALRDTFR